MSAELNLQSLPISSRPMGRLATDGNLTFLQECVRKDSESYRSEFIDRFEHFKHLMRLVELQSEPYKATSQSIIELVNFLGSVVFCYKDECKEFGSLVQSLLISKGGTFDPELRLSLCKAIVSLVNRQFFDIFSAMSLFFDHLLNCGDKSLRKFILSAIVSFIKVLTKSAKRRRKNQPKAKASRIRTNPSQLQSFLFKQLTDSRPISVRIAQMALVEAYRKQYWRNPKTSNALSDCVFHRIHRIQLCSIKFFLGSLNDDADQQDSSDSEADENFSDPSRLKTAISSLRHAKTTRKRKRLVEKTKKSVNHGKRKKREQTKYCNLQAIREIYDPQKFVDKLYGVLQEQKNEKYTTRLLQMGLCARVIGVHKLQTLGFYSYLQRYLQPRQKDVTRILLFAAQACHDFIPADIVDRLVRAIAYNFVTDCNTPEAITVGLNSIREIYISAPSAATEELVRDLAQYKSFRNKNVSMAARALINMIRSYNPKLLHPKDRGRPPQSSQPKRPKLSNSIKDDGEDVDEEMEAEQDDDDDIELISDDEESDETENELAEEPDNESLAATAGENEGEEQMEANDDEENDPFERNAPDGLPRLSAIEQFHKKPRRQTKAERLEQVRQGRENRPEYGRPKKTGAHVGRTNRELAKRKNFQMVRQKIRGKNRQRSFRDRQISLRKYLLKQTGRKIV